MKNVHKLNLIARWMCPTKWKATDNDPIGDHRTNDCNRFCKNLEFWFTPQPWRRSTPDFRLGISAMIWGLYGENDGQDPMVEHGRVEPTVGLSTAAHARVPFSGGYTSHAQILYMCLSGLNRKGFLRFHLWLHKNGSCMIDVMNQPSVAINKEGDAGIPRHPTILVIRWLQ